MGDIVRLPGPRRRRTVVRRELAEVIVLDSERIDRREAAYAAKMGTIADGVRALLNEADALRAEVGEDTARLYAQRAEERKNAALDRRATR